MKVLVYTSNKKYILATLEDMKENGINSGIYLNKGYKYEGESLTNSLKHLKSFGLVDNAGNYTFRGSELKEIPFYKDINTSEGFKYTFIKNIQLK
jgi:hypothetical protein